MIDKNKSKLEKYGLHPRFRYTKYNDRSVSVLCVLETDDRSPVASGFAFCSPLDCFNKAEARNISMGRALAAITHRMDCFPVKHGSKHEALKNHKNDFKAIYFREL